MKSLILISTLLFLLIQLHATTYGKEIFSLLLTGTLNGGIHD